MTVSLKHAFTSAIADGGDTSLVQPSNWNAEHNLTMATSRLLGRTTAGTGSAEEISAGTGLSLSAGTLAVSTVPVANGGTGATTANAGLTGLTTLTSTATAAGTTVLTNTSTYFQLFTGSTTQTITLPVTSTLATGWTFHIVNNSSGNLTVNSSGGNLVVTVLPGTTAMCTCIGTSLTTAADWESGLTDFSTATGTGSVVLGTSPTIATPTITTSAVIPLINGGTTASSTLTLQSTSGSGTTDAILFKTASQSEKMRLDTSGNLIIGNTTALAKLDIGPVDSADEGAEIRFRGATNATLDYFIDEYQSVLRFAKADKGAATNAAVRFQIGASGEWGIGGATYGTSGQALISGGTGAAPSWTSIYNVTPTVTSYTSGSGNWTIPSSGTFVLVRAWGGGGSGGRGGGTNARGTGGGGGGYTERLYQLSSLGSGGGTVAYSVAAGGTAVAVAGDGNPGGNSTFSTGANLLTAYGGGGGTGNKATTGGGGGGGALGAGGVGTDTAGGTAGPCGGAAGSYSTSGTTYPSTQWGGGGGGGTNAATALAGNPAYMGGGGGGGAGTLAASGGTSVGGGAGGAASIASGTPGTTGTAPGGGGGAQGANGGSSGAGGAGRIEIWVW